MTRTCTGLVLLVLCAPATAAPPTAAALPLLDAHGHPLPPGAIARFGDYRQRFSRVMSFSFSPDGRLIARSRDLGTDIREVATGRDVTPEFARGLLGTVEFTPGGHLYHSHFDAKTFRILDAVSGALRYELSAPGRFIHEVQFLPDDRGILAMVTDPPDGSHIRYFSTKEGANPAGRVVTKTPGQARFAVLSGGAQVVLSMGSGIVAVHDKATGALLHSFKLKDRGTSGSPLVALRDGKSVLVAHGEELIPLHLTPTGIEAGETTPGLASVCNLRLTADGTGVLLTGYSGSLWHVTWPDRKVVRKREQPLGLWRWAEPVPSADGRRIVDYGSADPGRVRDLIDGKDLFAYEELSPVQSLQFVGGDRVRVSDNSGTRVFELSTGRQLGHQRIALVESETTTAVAPDGHSFVTLPAFARGLTLRESGTGRERWRFELPKTTSLHEQACDAVFRPGGREVLAVSSERSFLLDAETGRELAEFAGGFKATFSADGRLLATGRKPPIRVHEVSTRGVRQTFDKPAPTVNDTVASRLRFSRDGRFLAGFGWSYGAVVWSVDDGTMVYSSVNPVPDNGFAVGDISPDGRWLVHADRFEHRVRVWDWTRPHGATQQVVLRGHHGELTDAAFTPEGKHLLTAGQDGTVLVWDMARVARMAAVRPRQHADDELWDALASRDAATAGRAVAEWRKRPDAAVGRFRRELPPATAPDPAAVAALVARLDHEVAAVRDAAEAELAGLAELAADALRPVAVQSASPEQRNRARRLLDRLGTVVTDPRRQRVVRAVEVIEHVGTPDARRLLTDWAAGAESALLSREARAALTRLTER